MLKGVNKTVIEVRCCESGYFDRAILFVNPSHNHLSKRRLSNEAEKYLRAINFDMEGTVTEVKDDGFKKTEKHGKILFLLVGCLAVAVAAVLIVFNRV